ncbi:Uncharacterised protein [Serratia liquefaciens]|uniref:hypothetical protein n=1 Tax=Serratia liquefaciens TaxID=614 RepID=UPI002179B08D|nr:hypothetical protein [Serratia liquefaciens]CAI0894793.1 Uncharacterised protein [Serratia liquefaciens]
MKMKVVTHATLVILPLLLSGLARANDQTIPWAENTGSISDDEKALTQGQNPAPKTTP